MSTCGQDYVVFDTGSPVFPAPRNWRTFNGVFGLDRFSGLTLVESRRHSMASSGHNGQPIGNHHCSFEWYHRLPLRPPIPPKWRPKYTHQNQLRDACCHLVNMIETSTSCVLCRTSLRAEQCRLLPNYFDLRYRSHILSDASLYQITP